MKKLYLIIISIFIFCFSANSQQVVTGEYFFDTDPGLGIANPISFAADSAVFIDSIPINVTGLANGYHWMYVRVKDSDNKWSHYRKQRFYVYDNSPIVQPIDTPKLMQAEYWIDSLPIAGTGTLINLIPDDTVFYNDSIPGLQLDTGGHVVSVRVKDSKGVWSLVKTDSVRNEYYDVDFTVLHQPFIRPNSKTKFKITFTNRSTVDIVEKYLVMKFPKDFIVEFEGLGDSINGVDISNVSKTIYIGGDNPHYVMPMWVGKLPRYQSISYNVYVTYPALARVDNTNFFELSGTVESDLQATFNDSNYIGSIINSGFSNSIVNTLYLLRDSLNLSSMEYFVLRDTIEAWMNSNENYYKKLVPLNSLTKPLIENIISSVLTDSAISKLNLMQFNHFNMSTYKIDTIEIDTANFSLTSQKQIITNCNCPIPNPVCIPFGFTPLYPMSQYEISDNCKDRCRCNCNAGRWKRTPRSHNALDLTIRSTASKSQQNDYRAGKFSIRSMFDGNASYYWSETYGNTVVVNSLDCNGQSFSVRYAHLHKVNLPPNGIVSAGDIIGTVGASGTVTGPHLHLEFFNSSGKIPPSCFALNSFYPPRADANTTVLCEELGETKCKIEIDAICSVSFDNNGNPKPNWKDSPDGTCPSDWVDKDKCDEFEPVGASDPNDKVGNEGFATPRYIKPTDELHYGIFFENVDSATAPAQIVHIVDTLDLTKVDASTFYLESVTAGEMLIVIPDSVHLQNLDTTFMEEPINGCYVRAQATFNSSTGVLDFLLTSLDTFPPYAPVQGVLEGFLPPDTTNFHGNGLVSFKVMPVASIPDDTIIFNTAHIIFDSNPAIKTGTWFNTIDRIEPISNVMALPACTYDTSFVVNWTGTDDGADIVAYDVYAKSSVDTAFTKWLSYTSLLADTFHGVLNSTYQFYSIAYDSVGNVENKQPLIEASTTVCPVGLNFIYNTSDLKIYPNPTTGRLIVEVVLEKSGKINVEIYNLLNQRLISFDGNDSNNKYFKKEIDVSNQPDGVYFIHLKVDGQNITKKFILKK